MQTNLNSHGLGLLQDQIETVNTTVNSQRLHENIEQIQAEHCYAKDVMEIPQEIFPSGTYRRYTVDAPVSRYGHFLEISEMTVEDVEEYMLHHDRLAIFKLAKSLIEISHDDCTKVEWCKELVKVIILAMENNSSTNSYLTPWAMSNYIESQLLMLLEDSEMPINLQIQSAFFERSRLVTRSSMLAINLTTFDEQVSYELWGTPWKEIYQAIRTRDLFVEQYVPDRESVEDNTIFDSLYDESKVKTTLNIIRRLGIVFGLGNMFITRAERLLRELEDADEGVHFTFNHIFWYIRKNYFDPIIHYSLSISNLMYHEHDYWPLVQAERREEVTRLNYEGICTCNSFEPCELHIPEDNYSDEEPDYQFDDWDDTVEDMDIEEYDDYIENIELGDERRRIQRLPELHGYVSTTPDTQCCICMDIKEEWVELPCHHKFHRICIDAWLNRLQRCPTCRVAVLNQLQLQAQSLEVDILLQMDMVNAIPMKVDQLYASIQGIDVDDPDVEFLPILEVKITNGPDKRHIQWIDVQESPTGLCILEIQSTRKELIEIRVEIDGKEKSIYSGPAELYFNLTGIVAEGTQLFIHYFSENFLTCILKSLARRGVQRGLIDDARHPIVAQSFEWSVFRTTETKFVLTDEFQPVQFPDIMDDFKYYAYEVKLPNEHLYISCDGFVTVYMGLDKIYEGDQLHSLYLYPFMVLGVDNFLMIESRVALQGVTLGPLDNRILSGKTLFIAVGTRGDVQPYLELAKQCEESCFLVSDTVGSIPNGIYFSKTHSILIRSAELEVGGPFVGRAKLLTMPTIMSMYTEINDLIKQFKPDYIIANSVAFGASFIAALNDIPCHIMQPFPLSGRARINLSAETFMGESYLTLLGDMELKMLRQLDRVWAVSQNITYHEIPLFATGMYDSGLTGENVSGYLFSTDLPVVHDQIAKFLITGQKPVCVGFGSMQMNSQVKHIVDLLIYLQQRVVVVAKQFDYKHPDVIVVDYVDHHWLLPQIDLVICHGGSGTVHTVLKYGCKIGIIPHISDQSYWCDQLKKKNYPMQRLVGTNTEMRNKLRELISMEKRAFRLTGGLRNIMERIVLHKNTFRPVLQHLTIQPAHQFISFSTLVNPLLNFVGKLESKIFGDARLMHVSLGEFDGESYYNLDIVQEDKKIITRKTVGISSKVAYLVDIGNSIQTIEMLLEGKDINYSIQQNCRTIIDKILFQRGLSLEAIHKYMKRIVYQKIKMDDIPIVMTEHIVKNEVPLIQVLFPSLRKVPQFVQPYELVNASVLAAHAPTLVNMFSAAITEPSLISQLGGDQNYLACCAFQMKHKGYGSILETKIHSTVCETMLNVVTPLCENNEVDYRNLRKSYHAVFKKIKSHMVIGPLDDDFDFDPVKAMKIMLLSFFEQSGNTPHKVTFSVVNWDHYKIAKEWVNKIRQLEDRNFHQLWKEIINSDAYEQQTEILDSFDLAHKVNVKQNNNLEIMCLDQQIEVLDNFEQFDPVHEINVSVEEEMKNEIVTDFVGGIRYAELKPGIHYAEPKPGITTVTTDDSSGGFSVHYKGHISGFGQAISWARDRLRGAEVQSIQQQQ